ncbi:MAG: hypothetical protein KJO00_11640, partial [Bacteroidia bacterium]|nr:hypothetical protein [Bacteroidia bacterium]
MVVQQYYRFLLLILSLSFVNWIDAQVNIPPNIQAEGNQFYCPLTQINVVSAFDIIDPDDMGIESLHIQITSGYNG